MGDRMRSFLEIHDLASGETRLVLATNRLIEAPRIKTQERRAAAPAANWKAAEAEAEAAEP